MPSQHFGSLGTAMSPFDMRHMSSALSDYSQHGYVQSQPQAQMTQASAINPNPAYSPYPHQQFASQPSGQYPSQHLHHSHPQLQGGYSGYNTNVQGHSSDLHLRSQNYLTQHQVGYSVNMPQQPPYPAFAGQQGQYGQMPTTGYQARMGTTYQMPRLQVESPYMAPGNPSHSQHHQGMAYEILRLESC